MHCVQKRRKKYSLNTTNKILVQKKIRIILFESLIFQLWLLRFFFIEVMSTINHNGYVHVFI